MKRTILIIVGCFVALVLLFFYEVLWAPNTFEGDRWVTVSKGETFRQVMDSLEQSGIIRSRLLFKIAGYLQGSTTKMQIGKYRFKSGMSNRAILADIRYGISIEMVSVTIPEGLRASRQAKIFAKGLGIDSIRFMELLQDTALIHQLNVDAASLEGYLMPKTYKFYWQTDEAEIVRTLVGEFWNEFTDSMKIDARRRGRSINEILTLASIIENETSIDSERAMIAGVYYNRLKKGMRLQADPTIQYVIEGGPRRLRYSDLYLESAYNTYRRAGLPPGPVSNPSRASIIAALYPAKHKYLFFVATGQGGHRFSRTFDEHKRAILEYRKIREEQNIQPEG
jgi:UPF0755 protein